MSEKFVTVTASEIDNALGSEDKVFLEEMGALYAQGMEYMRRLSESSSSRDEQKLIDLYGQMGVMMQEAIKEEEAIRVYSFETPRSLHGEASYLIAKLRDKRTQRAEFTYYIQRAYELLFNLAFHNPVTDKKNHLIIPTPVSEPVNNFAVHKIPDIDTKIENTSMCVMLRGALLPSMILSKSIQEYSSMQHITPFSLFRIRRIENDHLSYQLNLSASYVSWEDLHDKDLLFADPMNATGGSLITVVRYLESKNIRPRSIQFFTVISALKGTLQVLRSISGLKIYTLWMDPMLNEASYIMPGLGDAGDRLNGVDEGDSLRNIIQLIADYDDAICNLYRAQVHAIEKAVLG